MGEQVTRRVVALDWMRGLVMLLMTVDHASVFFNQGRVADDSAATYVAGSVLPLGPFMTRWVTHLCAPTFLFLAGVGLAHSTARRVSAGEPRARIDRDLLLRGAIILAFELLYMSRLAGHLMLQVLYAIGLSMMLMTWLRRLPDRALLGLALGWFACGELLTDLAWDPPANAALPAALTVARSVDAHAAIFYPVVPWLAMMMLGWVFGNHLRLRGPAVAARTLWIWGAGALLVFLLVRGLSGYGNMWLLRQDDSLQQWLHVSKYPPSLAYATLELGLMALLTAALLSLRDRIPVRPRGPVLVFGQTALFFYLAHFLLLGTARKVVGIEPGGLPRTFQAAAVVLVVLYPACLWFRARKRANPAGWLRFI